VLEIAAEESEQRLLPFHEPQKDFATRRCASVHFVEVQHRACIIAAVRKSPKCHAVRQRGRYCTHCTTAAGMNSRYDMPQLAWHATLRLSWPRRPAIGAKAARLLHCLLLAPSNRQAHAAAASVAADRWRRPRQANGASAGIPRPPPVAAPPWTPTCSVSPPNAVAGRAAAVDSATEWSV